MRHLSLFRVSALLFLALAMLCSVASAQAVPDPVSDPAATASVLSHLYSTGAFFCLGIVGVYIALKLASTRVAWLEVPGRAHYVTVALAVLAIFAVPAMQGTTPNASMLMVAFGTAMSLLLPGAPGDSSKVTVQSTTVSVAKTSQSGRVGMPLLIALAFGSASMVIALQGCSPTTNQKTIATTVTVLDATNTAFAGSAAGCNGCFVQRYEQSIIATASSAADGAAKLAAFRGKVASIELGVAAAYQAAATAYAANTSGAAAAVVTAAAAVAADITKLEGSAAQ